MKPNIELIHLTHFHLNNLFENKLSCGNMIVTTMAIANCNLKLTINFFVKINLRFVC